MSHKTTARITIRTGSCSVFVQGMTFVCPLCGVEVQSGEHHECEVQNDKVIRHTKGKTIDGKSNPAR